MKPLFASARRTALRLDWQAAAHFALLAAVVWAAHFLLQSGFGFYEDDYTYIAKPLGWSASDLLTHLHDVWRGWPQGRPLGYTLPQLTAYLGGQLGGLRPIYLAAFLIHALNASLFFVLLRRWFPHLPSLTGALAFALYPADTTHPLLMHSLGLHTSLTFLLLASLLYHSPRRPLSYLFALASLLTYETPYPVFLAVPLLGRGWDRTLLKDWLRHALIWAVVMALVVAIRYGIGEARLTAAATSSPAPLTILSRTLASMVIGPWTSLSTFILAPWWLLSHLNAMLVVAMALALIGFLLMLLSPRWNSGSTPDGSRQPSETALTGREASIPYSASRLAALRVLAVSLLCLAAGYTLSFTHYPPTITYGRATSVHLASTFGGSLLVASLVSIALPLKPNFALRLAAVTVLSAWLALLLAYSVAIQLDFRQAWTNQRLFWAQVVPLVPDARDGTMIFVLDHDLPATRFIYTHSWADPIILEQLLRFPTSWDTPPRLFVVPSDWTGSIVSSGSDLLWEVPPATWPAHWETLPPGNVILLEMDSGNLVRRSGEFSLGSRSLALKMAPPRDGAQRPDGPLYPYMLPPP